MKMNLKKSFFVEKISQRGGSFLDQRLIDFTQKKTKNLKNLNSNKSYNKLFCWVLNQILNFEAAMMLYVILKSKNFNKECYFISRLSVK